MNLPRELRKGQNAIAALNNICRKEASEGGREN